MSGNRIIIKVCRSVPVDARIDRFDKRVIYSNVIRKSQSRALKVTATCRWINVHLYQCWKKSWSTGHEAKKRHLLSYRKKKKKKKRKKQGATN